MSLINQHRASLGPRPVGLLAVADRLCCVEGPPDGRLRRVRHDDVAPPVTRTVWGPNRNVRGYGSSAGENIAEGYRDAQSVANAWLGSAGHKQNIESPSYVVTGVGAATAANGNVYWAGLRGHRRRRLAAAAATTTDDNNQRAATPTHDDQRAAAGHDDHCGSSADDAVRCSARPQHAQGDTVGTRRLVLTTRVVSSGAPVTSAM